MIEPITTAINAVVKCSICNASYGTCDCWSACSCGWSYEKGEECNNPDCQVNY